MSTLMENAVNSLRQIAHHILSYNPHPSLVRADSSIVKQCIWVDA